MIKLKFCKKNIIERKKIVTEFREQNLMGRQRGKIRAIEEWCKKYLSNIDDKSYDFNAVIEAEPEELLKIKTHLDDNYDVGVIMDELPHSQHCYIETTLYNKMHLKAKRKLLDNLNVEVCPYCNRNYVFSDNRVNTCVLDHFIPKRKYPIFACSFYNLIPVCHYCNGKKGEQEFVIHPHAFQGSTDDLLKFSYKVLGADYLKSLEDIEVELEILDNRYESQAELLKLKDLYKHHKDIVQDVLKKNIAFSDIYLECLSKEFSALFETKTEVKELLYGISFKEEGYGKRPLEKLVQDVVKEIEH